MEVHNGINNQPVIVDGVRTPFRRSNKAFKDVSALDLGAIVIRALLEKTNLPMDAVDHVCLGSVIANPSMPNIAREASLAAGLDPETPGNSVSLACISSNVASTQLADMISLGRINIGIAGGVDTFSDPPIRISQKFRKTLALFSRIRGFKGLQGLAKELSTFRFKDFYLDVPQIAEFSNGKTMGQGSEILASSTGVLRQESDEFALFSHQNAINAAKAGVFAEDIAAVYDPKSFKPILEDDGPRADTSIESLTKLRPVFEKTFGVSTAGNSSFLTDGASSLLLMSYKKAKDLSMSPRAFIRDYIYTSGDTLKEMLSGPALSIPKLLKRNNLRAADIDVWEIHEAFACQMVANLKLLSSKKYVSSRLAIDDFSVEIPMDKLNIWGGSLSLGHPFGATGTRLLHMASRRLREYDKRYAVVSGCAAGGHGSAILLENCEKRQGGGL
jgi:acetyl-CoA acetyltransferase family protein